MSVRLLVLAFGIGLLHSFGVSAAGAQVWLAGVDPVVRTTFDPHSVPDYLDLFDPSAPWDKAAQAVQVFKTSTQFLANAPDSTLSRMFADLKRRNIALAMEALMLTATPRCGKGVEGYSSPQLIEKVASRVQQLGGDLRYVAMDEPLDFGHSSHQPNACQSSLAELAADVAGKVLTLRRIFPAIQIGDIETIGNPGRTDEVDLIMEWAKAYEAAAGVPLSFVHADILWRGPWKERIKQLATRLHASGIKFGIIYNGNPDDGDGVAWTRHAEERFAMVEADPALTPDQAILQTWMVHPLHMLPESRPGTMSWLVNRYIAAPTRLTLSRTGGALTGQLADNSGHALGAKSVNLSSETLGQADAPIQRSRSGEVPPTASAALVGLRINAECNCSGPADVILGTVRYHDDRSGQSVDENFRQQAAISNIPELVGFQARPGQPVNQNTRTFPVTPGDPFTFQVPIHADLASAGSGYVALIFLDSSGKEIQRLRMPFEPAEHHIGEVLTDSHGGFRMDLDPGTIRASVGFHAEFPGDTQHRGATASLQ